MTTCNRPTCDTPAKCRGLCARHYRQDLYRVRCGRAPSPYLEGVIGDPREEPVDRWVCECPQPTATTPLTLYGADATQCLRCGRPPMSSLRTAPANG